MASDLQDAIMVEVDIDLEDIVPGYLENRRRELAVLTQAASTGDFETLRRLGHDLKGTGGGYGFDALSELGRSLEQASRDGDSTAAGRVIAEIQDYLARVRVSFA